RTVKAKQEEAAAQTEALKARLFELRKQGFNRLYQSGNIYEFSTPESLLEIDFSKPLFALVDRIVISSDSRARTVDALETGYRQAGEAIFETVPHDGAQSRQLRFSRRFECS